MKAIVASLMLVALTGCDQVELYRFESAAKDAMRANMVDPDSAQFRELVIRHRDGMRILCGEVNAKNRMGGYVGFRPFFIEGSKDGAAGSFGDPVVAPDNNAPVRELEQFLRHYRMSCQPKV